MTALHAHRTHTERDSIRINSTRNRARVVKRVVYVPMQKECGSAALNNRLEMQEHRRAICRLQSPVAADLLSDSELLDPAAPRTATQRWCDIAERELHLATAQVSWFRTASN